MEAVIVILWSSVCLLLVCDGRAVSFQTKCLERHFWLSVRSSFLSPMTRFNFEDQHGLHSLSEREAALCGYTFLKDEGGDLVFRASFLACHVRHQTSSDYQLRVWLVNVQEGLALAAYPLHLHCSAQGPWSTREIICEENYMEVLVSIQPPIASTRSENDEMEQVDAAAVMFHTVDRPPAALRALSQSEAANLGYHVSLRGPRLILRCPFSSPFANLSKDKGVTLETVTAIILHNKVAVDATVACPLSEAMAEGDDLLWTTPHVPTPLVRGPFWGGAVRVGVDGDALSGSDAQWREYRTGMQGGKVEVRIPFGAHGGRVKSGVLRGQYSVYFSVDVWLMNQWQDQYWPITQHRLLKQLKTPLVPQTIYLTKNEAPSEGLFSVTFGPFLPDVSLQRAAVDSGGDLLTWHQHDLNISRRFHPNGSHSYQLSLSLSHPKVIPEYIGGGHKTYSFSFSFTLSISPSGEVFYHQADIQHDVEYTVVGSPRLEGKCTEGSLLVLLHHGAQDHLYLGGHRLDWELVERAGMVVDADEDLLAVEIPLHSPGVTYEALTLKGVVAGVEVSVLDAETLKTQERLLHKCAFPARELLACLPEGRMVAIVDTTHSIPPTQPNRTTLSDPSCVPMETDSSRALFSFSLNSCGTTATTEGDFLLYENQISYNQDFLPLDTPVIHRDSPYRLTLQCRYPINNSNFLAIQHPFGTLTVKTLKRN